MMRKQLVEPDAFKGIHCSVCKKDLGNEERIVESTEIFGRWMCIDCFYDRQLERQIGARIWG